MKTRTRKFSLALTVPALVALLLLVFAAVGWAAGTHSATEPTWYYRGVVTHDAGVKMKHVTVVHDPLGLEGVAGNPKFMMWWGTSSPDQLFAATSNDGVNWSGTGSARTRLSVTFPSSSVPLYHPEVIYDRLGFVEKKSAGVVHFKMWFYDAGTENYNWIRYAESSDGINWTVFEDSPCAAPGCTNPSNKNYLEFSGGSGNEMSVLYKRDGTGIVVNGADQKYVGYQATNNPVAISTDGAWFFRVDGQGGGPTDVCREMIIAGGDDVVNYRAWDDLPGDGDLTSWDSATGLSWNSPEAGNAPIVGASWSDFYGALSVVVVGDRYYMYDTMNSDNYSVGLLVAPLVPPTEVWVDDGWTSQTDVDAFDPSLIWQYDAFNSIQDGIDAVAGSTVNVRPGTYNERVTINKSVDLRGAQYGVDPTAAGARTNLADESVITEAGLSTPNPDVLIEIPSGVTNVTVDGFTLEGDRTNTTADTSVVCCWDDNITISHNIIDGMYGVLYKGGDTLMVHHNRMVVNKAGVVVQPNPASNVTVSDNIFNLGIGPIGDESAFYMTSCGQCSATGNTATGFTGRGIGGSNLHHLTISGNTLIGNRDAISIWGGSTFITIMDNILADSSRYGINIKGQDVNITGNTIDNSNDTGINIDRHVIDTERVTVLCNNISGNTNYGVKAVNVTEIINAEYNWWGDASGPTHVSNPGGSGDAVSDGVDFDPWLSAPVGDTCPPPADAEGPITSNVVVTPNPAPVNTAIVLTANVDDSTTGGSNIASAEYNIDSGNFVAMNAQDESFDEVSEDIEATVPAFAAAGIHEVCVRGTDAAGNVGSETCITLSVNAPPSVSADGPYEDNEGSPISLAGLADDPDGPSLTTTWTYVPVANVDEGAICEFGDANALATTFTCTDDGTYRVTLTGADGINSPVEANADVTVHNVEPEVTIINPVDGDLFAVDTTVNLSAAFTDASTNDTHDCLISWDDGTAEPGTVSEDNGAGTCDGSHLYSAAGVYAIQVIVTDDDDGDTTESVMVVVYDPEGGFVTGGGWIWSPVGAYYPDGTLEGKATFGFVSKYKKGAQTPEGQTEFVFKVADLNFHSSSYDWLVVAGAKAKFKGTGTINGEGEYKFMLTGIDADLNESDNFEVDRFRIKIWTEDAGGNEIVVYDNALGDDGDDATTEIGGGSIVIHTKKK